MTKRSGIQIFNGLHSSRQRLAAICATLVFVAPKLGLMQPHAGRCILAETARILRPIGPLSPIEMGRMEVAIADRSMSDTCLVVLNGVDEDGPNDGILGEGRKRECRLS